MRDWLHLRTNNNHTMTESEAIRAQHSVRKYTDKTIEADKVATIRLAIENINAQSGLNIQLVLEEHNGHLHQFVMSDTDDVTAVEIGYKLDTPVENNLYEYITEQSL